MTDTAIEALRRAGLEFMASVAAAGNMNDVVVRDLKLFHAASANIEVATQQDEKRVAEIIARNDYLERMQTAWAGKERDELRDNTERIALLEAVCKASIAETLAWGAAVEGHVSAEEYGVYAQDKNALLATYDKEHPTVCPTCGSDSPRIRHRGCYIEDAPSGQLTKADPFHGTGSVTP